MRVFTVLERQITQSESDATGHRWDVSKVTTGRQLFCSKKNNIFNMSFDMLNIRPLIRDSIKSSKTRYKYNGVAHALKRKTVKDISRAS